MRFFFLSFYVIVRDFSMMGILIGFRYIHVTWDEYLDNTRFSIYHAVINPRCKLMMFGFVFTEGEYIHVV